MNALLTRTQRIKVESSWKGLEEEKTDSVPLSSFINFKVGGKVKVESEINRKEVEWELA